MILRLLANETDDLAVISSLVQDAVCRVGDIRYDVKARTVLLTMNRFCWENGKFTPPARMRAALQISDVSGLKSKGIALAKNNGVLSLLSLEFEPDPKNVPGGTLALTFSDKGEIAIEVEVLDVALVDLSGPWGAKGRPKHGR